MDKGWVKLHRSLMDNPLWRSEPFTKGQAWVDLFMRANHQDNIIFIKGQPITVKRGQSARSELSLCEEWQWSKGKVRRFLKMLKNDTMVEQKTGHLTSIITICNYESFQSTAPTHGTPEIMVGGTPDGTPDVPLTVHKQECKKEKNEKKVLNKTLTSPTVPVDADEVFSFWVDVMNKKRCLFTAKRLKAVKARLKDGYSVNDIQQAITNCAANPWNMGANDRGMVFNDLELICRTGDKLENFRDNPYKEIINHAQAKPRNAHERFKEDCRIRDAKQAAQSDFDGSVVGTNVQPIRQQVVVPAISTSGLDDLSSGDKSEWGF